METIVLKPQPGPQEQFLATDADICIYGGSAGSGKSFSLLLDPLRYMNVDGYKCVVFRRNYTQIMAAGGLWDESQKMYRQIPGTHAAGSPKAHWTFNNKATVSFDYLARDNDVYKWQGSQICALCCEVNTGVVMADGTTKKVKDIQVGDKVRTLKGTQTVTAVGVPQMKECVIAELPNGDKQIQSTNHKVLTRYGWLSYEDCVSKHETRIIDAAVCAEGAPCVRLQYSHPYTGITQISAQRNICFQRLRLSPCGNRCVRSFTVSSDNHYVTTSGLINQNCFDELTHFSEKQFFYMLSRNRSTCGVKPYVRATCNPDSESWVAEFISWWIDQDTGYPIKERGGVKRYFTRIEDEVIWGDTAEEVAEKTGVDPSLCKSVTFIPSSIFDNQELLKVDPSYLASLNALSLVERERLLNGNWKIRPAAGLYFPKDHARIISEIPDKLVTTCRAWDLAATEETAANKDPDRTCGTLWGKLRNGQFVVLDAIRVAYNASSVRDLVLRTAQQDKLLYGTTRISIPQDPGQAGKDQARSYIKMLSGYTVISSTVNGNKVTRAEPLAAQWQRGNVYLMAGEWNKQYIAEMDGFPDMLHDDYVDSSSDGFKVVSTFANWGGLVK